MGSTAASILFLLAVVTVPLVIVGFAIWRGPASHARMSPIQRLLWGLAYLLVKFRWRTQWLGTLPLAEGQGAVIVSNHRSSVDPFFIQTATGRKIHWLVAREYCEHPALRWFLSACEVIAVSRGGIDTAATKTAIRLASEGGIVGMLPEGRINMTEEFMLPMRPGAALVALKARVPVVPCYIRGAPFRRYSWSPLLMPARVDVTFGPPIDLSEFYDREGDPDLTESVMERIARALAKLAGQPGFEPQIAGRNWKPTDEELALAMDEADQRRARSTESQSSGSRGKPGA
jgi:1-acyl-sn-glycerol-3-phosphate acyltransferase